MQINRTMPPPKVGFFFLDVELLLASGCLNRDYIFQVTLHLMGLMWLYNTQWNQRRESKVHQIYAGAIKSPTISTLTLFINHLDIDVPRHIVSHTLKIEEASLDSIVKKDFKDENIPLPPLPFIPKYEQDSLYLYSLWYLSTAVAAVYGKRSTLSYVIESLWIPSITLIYLLSVSSRS